MRLDNDIKPKKHRYNAVRAAEQQLQALQNALAAEQLKREEFVEQSIVLADMLHVRDFMKELCEKHRGWLQAGGPTAQELQEQHGVPQPQGEGPHWVLNLVHSATWEQLQQALAMTADDWTANLNCYYALLVDLLEWSKKCPDIAAHNNSGSGRPSIAASYSITYLHSMHPAWDAAVEAMRREGIMAYLGLLHAPQALFEAARTRADTGEVASAPASHWLYIARRMRFTRLQKLHFKLALQNFARHSRATAERGLTILQQAPSYAFLIACELIAAQQLQDSDGSGMAAGATAAAPAAPAAPAAAAAAGPAAAAPAGVASGSEPSSSRYGSERSQTPNSTSTCNGHSTPASGSPGGGAAAGAGIAAAAGTGADTGAATAGSAGADVRMVGTLDDELAQVLSTYMHEMVFLNVFLADTLTLEQVIIMNVGAYPFWPLLSAIAEAALQLPASDEQGAPDDPCSEVPVAGVQLLMQERRQGMLYLHNRWWEQYAADSRQQQQQFAAASRQQQFAAAVSLQQPGPINRQQQ